MSAVSDCPRPSSRTAPVVGGSAAFRRFIREELMPQVKARYNTTGETALIGDSLS